MQWAQFGDSIILTLEDEIDISRGDMLVRAEEPISGTHAFEATICWMGEQPLRVGRPYIIAHSTREAAGQLRSVNYRLDVETLQRDHPSTLELNEIGSVIVTTSRPLFLDTYKDNRATGRIILIDPAINVPVGAGMVTRTSISGGAEQLEIAQGRGLIVWLDSHERIAIELEAHLGQSGYSTVRLSPNFFVNIPVDFESHVWNIARMLRNQGTVVIVTGARNGPEDVVHVLLTDGNLPEDEPGKLYARTGDVDGADLTYRLEPYLV